MKKPSLRLNLIVLSVLLCLIAAGSQFASAQQGQGQGQRRPEPDPLMGLKHSLEAAGAPALSAEQEQQLKTLVQQFRDSHGPKEPDEALKAAHAAYDAAILAGDAAAANAQAQVIAGLVSGHAAENLQAETALKIQALSIIKSSEAQLSALVTKFGESGVVRILSSLVGGGRFGGPGGPGGFGGPGGPPGPRGPGRPEGQGFGPRASRP